MKLLSVLFDAVLLPVAVAKDVLMPPIMYDKSKSETRKQIEKIEDGLG